MKKGLFKISTTHIIMSSFFMTIIVGSLLLCLPISSASGKATPFVDAFFTATTSTCVTGLVVVPTFSYWSTFGHIVILVLIQIGGLGVITVISALALILRKKVGLSEGALLQDAFNLNNVSKIGGFIKKVIKGTFVMESIGALLYMIVFVPQFGPRGIWISVFNAVSAFCNAGIDIIGSDSLCGYTENVIINLVTSTLIILGGLGFIVWWDVLSVVKSRKRFAWKFFSLHTKIVLTCTAVLILLGAILIFIFEYNNPKTIGEMSLFGKIQASFFQSITTRTAGFCTVAQENFTTPTSLVSIFLMFIGGSPVGTAGGIKTVTFAVLAATAYSTVRNRNEVSIYGRRILKNAVSKAVGVCFISFSILAISTVLLSAVCDAPFLDILYEATSAIGTVGLSRNLTFSLDTVGKLIIIATMYLGRVGPISLAIAFAFKKQNENIIKNPTEEINIG